MLKEVDTPVLDIDWSLFSMSIAQDVLDAFGGVPYVNAVLRLAAKILEIVQGLQKNKGDYQRLGKRAESIAISLAKAQQQDGFGDVDLQEDLYDVRLAMHEVITFLESERKASHFWRIGMVHQTASKINALDQRLDNAFRDFSFRSSISVRSSQTEIGNMLVKIYEAVTMSRASTPAPPDTAGEAQMLPEGIYQIANKGTGCAIEIEHGSHPDGDVYLTSSLEMACRRQLWSITRARLPAAGYWIKSIHDGQALDQRAGDTFICTQPWHGDLSQAWKIEVQGKVGDASSTCTIQSAANNCLLDSHCEKLQSCSRIHCTSPHKNTISQQWNFVLLQQRPPPSLSAPFGFLNPIFIQNKGTKHFLTQHTSLERPIYSNISCVEEATVRSAWTFSYRTRVGRAGSNKVFIIASLHYSSTLNHREQQVIHGSPSLGNNACAWWEVIPCGAASVVIKNYASGQLLCDSSSRTQAADAREHDSPFCQWHIVEDPNIPGPPQICIVYDASIWLTDPAAMFRASLWRTISSDTQNSTSKAKRSRKKKTSNEITQDQTFYANQEQVQRASTPQRPTLSLSPGITPSSSGHDLRVEFNEAAKRERDLVRKVMNHDLTCFVFGTDEVDVGGDEGWDRVRVLSMQEEIMGSRKGSHCC